MYLNPQSAGLASLRREGGLLVAEIHYKKDLRDSGIFADLTGTVMIFHYSTVQHFLLRIKTLKIPILLYSN
jgi:hypothetical protein